MGDQIEYIKVDESTLDIRRTKTINLDDLKDELTNIESQLNIIAKQPDQILVDNEEKKQAIDMLTMRKSAIEELLSK